MLSVLCWAHANKLHPALSALFCRSLQARLPSVAWWLTRTRLCWQHKKKWQAEAHHSRQASVCPTLVVRLTASGLGRRLRLLWGHKSSARLLSPPERRSDFVAWDTPNVHDTVDVLGPDSGNTALGSTFLAPVGTSTHEPGMRSATVSVDHAPH